MLAITIFNLTDTFFVSRLGTEALAAMGFTFPVVMVVGAISTGMATGAGSVLARAMGSQDHHLANRAATDGILLSVLTVIVVSSIGLLTMDPLFTLLGADAQTLPLVRDYMSIWYLGAIAVIMPPVGDSSMRALGDMKRPLVVMLVCAVLNAILDPIFIFGLAGFPAMGISGAALATIISRAAGMVTTLSFVHFHYGLIDLKYKSGRELIESWRRILHVGLPASVVRLFPQLLRAVLTTLAASVGGVAAVAALAAGTRIESFALIISMAAGTALMPIVGQNWGAGRLDRVNEVRRLMNRWSGMYGLVAFALVLPTAPLLATIFTSDPTVIAYTSWYLRLAMVGMVGFNLTSWTSGQLNAAGKPRWVIILNVGGTVAIMIPLVVLGARLLDFHGMIAGLVAGQLLVGLAAARVGKRELAGEPGVATLRPAP
jgi:putative MATE family efflux protein